MKRNSKKKLTKSDIEQIPVFNKKNFHQLLKQPIIEVQLWRSDDNKWIVHETRILEIKPISALLKKLK